MVHLTFGGYSPLNSADYEPLDRISRCLHVDDVQESIRSKRLISQPIKNTKISSLRHVKVCSIYMN